MKSDLTGLIGWFWLAVGVVAFIVTMVQFISNFPKGKLITKGMIYHNFPWETPVKEYRKFGDYYLPSKADVIYKRPEGDFCYLKFKLENIQYN